MSEAQVEVSSILTCILNSVYSIEHQCDADASRELESMFSNVKFDEENQETWFKILESLQRIASEKVTLQTQLFRARLVLHQNHLLIGSNSSPLSETPQTTPRHETTLEGEFHRSPWSSSPATEEHYLTSLGEDPSSIGPGDVQVLEKA